MVRIPPPGGQADDRQPVHQEQKEKIPLDTTGDVLGFANSEPHETTILDPRLFCRRTGSF